MLKFIAYYRVSTDRQGESGLGLDAQRASVALFTRGASLLSEFQEIESGKRHANRPQLAGGWPGSEFLKQRGCPMSRVWDMGFGGGMGSDGVSYDGDGRLLNDGAKSYLWEMQGWLCGVTSAGNHYQYIYDAEGRLVTTASRPDAQCGLNTTTLADYIVDQFGHPITEADGSAHWRHTNVYADGELLATNDGAPLPDFAGRGGDASGSTGAGGGADRGLQTP